MQLDSRRFQKLSRCRGSLQRPKCIAMPKAEEHVLVIRRELFDSLGSFQGICPDVERYLPEFLKRENNFFAPRSSAENDPSLKQLIPYAVFHHGGRILHYTRGAKSGEKRLVAKSSIGIGGHINDTDESLFAFDRAAYEAAVQREFSEELHIAHSFLQRPVALLNDDCTEVGRVHLGIVHWVTLSDANVKAAEKAIASLGFATPEELLARRESFETWSQIILDQLDAIAPRGWSEGVADS